MLLHSSVAIQFTGAELCAGSIPDWLNCCGICSNCPLTFWLDGIAKIASACCLAFQPTCGSLGEKCQMPSLVPIILVVVVLVGEEHARWHSGRGYSKLSA